MKLKKTLPPTKDDFGKFWWVRDNHTRGQIVPARVVVWRNEMTFNAVGYQRCGELGWSAADDLGVEWFGPVDMPEADA